MKWRQFLFQKNGMWLNVLKYIVIAAVIVTVVLVLDYNLAPVADRLPDFLVTSTDMTVSALSTLAGAMITVIIFIFSTTMVVLTTYAAQFSPRIIENFLRTKSFSQVFGVFIGGFLYCITALIFIRKGQTEDTVLVSVVAMVYLLLCVISFIVFVYSVTTSIQVQNLLSSLYREAARVVEKFVQSRHDTVRVDSYDISGYSHTYDVLAHENGFFEENNIDLLHNLLRGHKYTIVLFPRIGDFISVNQKIAALYYGDGLELTDDLKKNLSDALVMEEMRFTSNDYRFAIQKIIDVALRSVSPAINDPNSGIYCVQYLGVLMGRLSRVDGDYAEIIPSGNPDAKIIDQDFVFRKDLRDTFLQILHYAKADISVVMAILEALYAAMIVATEKNRAHIHTFAQYVYDSSIGNFDSPIEQELVREKLDAIKGCA